MRGPLYWSIRRELWENRSVYLAPLFVAAVFVFGFMFSTIGMSQRRRAVLALDPLKQRAVIGQPYDIAAIFLIFTAFIVAIFYCLDALYGERRDRSILFWKSLPVGDQTTVFAKAAIPLVILPAVVFVTVVVTQFIMLLISSAVLLPSGLAGTTWSRFNLIEQSFIFLYSVIAMALWHAPVYSYLLLVSAWARRAVLLWAVLPLICISVLEKLAFSSVYFSKLLQWRLIGFTKLAYDMTPRSTVDSLSQLTPARFLVSPGLWLGLMFAAACLVAAARMRRNREPI